MDYELDEVYNEHCNDQCPECGNRSCDVERVGRGLYAVICDFCGADVDEIEVGPGDFEEQMVRY